MAISRLPDDPLKIARSTKVVPEKKIQEFINKGGKPTKGRREGFSIRWYERSKTESYGSRNQGH